MTGLIELGNVVSTSPGGCHLSIIIAIKPGPDRWLVTFLSEKGDVHDGLIWCEFVDSYFRTVVRVEGIDER